MKEEEALEKVKKLVAELDEGGYQLKVVQDIRIVKKPELKLDGNKPKPAEESKPQEEPKPEQ